MNSKYKILVKFPSRERPEKFFATMANIVLNFTDIKNYQVLVTLDEDDDSMRTPEVVSGLKEYMSKFPVKVVYGTSTSKIHAVNRDIKEETYPWDICLVMSDDMVIMTKGFDEIIRSKFLVHFPDTDGNLHFNDGYTQNKLCTLTIMGKKYCQQNGGWLYYPGYKSFYSDDEYTRRAIKQGKMRYFDNIHCRHDGHPMNNPALKGEKDELYIRNDAPWKEDGALFSVREQKGFPIDITF